MSRLERLRISLARPPLLLLATSQTQTWSRGRWTSIPTATLSSSLGPPAPQWRASLPLAMLQIMSTDRPSHQQARGPWQPSTPSVGSVNRGIARLPLHKSPLLQSLLRAPVPLPVIADRFECGSLGAHAEGAK